MSLTLGNKLLSLLLLRLIKFFHLLKIDLQMLTLNLHLEMEMGLEMKMAEDPTVMAGVVDLTVMVEAMAKDLLEMEVVMAVDLKGQLDPLVLVEDRAMEDGARVDQEGQEDPQEV